MNQPDATYQEMRDIWLDYNDRQKFEHELLDRKTTWLLATQALLFTAYGVTFGNNEGDDLPTRFRLVVEWSGLTVAVITLIGIVAIINSKRLSWIHYRDFYGRSETPNAPRPLDAAPLA